MKRIETRTRRRPSLPWVALVCSAILMSCDGTPGGAQDECGGDDGAEPEVGYEILQILGPNEIVVWASGQLTEEEFEAIELSPGWFKNQPREIDVDGGAILRSPGATEDGIFVEEEHFGHTWLHNATVIETNIELDEGGLLAGTRVAKFHDITLCAGRTVSVLVSPEGDHLVRVSRDAGRTTDESTVPDEWELIEYVLSDDFMIELPNPTLNVRTDNEDSYQGPVPALDAP